MGSPEGGYVAISPSDLFLMPFPFVEGEDGGTTLVIAGEMEAAEVGRDAGTVVSHGGPLKD